MNKALIGVLFLALCLASSSSSPDSDDENYGVAFLWCLRFEPVREKLTSILREMHPEAPVVTEETEYRINRFSERLFLSSRLAVDLIPPRRSTAAHTEVVKYHTDSRPPAEAARSGTPTRSPSCLPPMPAANAPLRRLLAAAAVTRPVTATPGARSPRLMRASERVMASTSAKPEAAASIRTPASPSQALRASPKSMITASRAPKLSAARSSRGFSKGAAAVSSALAAEDRQ